MFTNTKLFSLKNNLENLIQKSFVESALGHKMEGLVEHKSWPILFIPNKKQTGRKYPSLNLPQLLPSS